MAYVESVDPTYARFVLATLAIEKLRNSKQSNSKGEEDEPQDTPPLEDDTLRLEGTLLEGAVRTVPLCRQVAGPDGPFSDWEPASAFTQAKRDAAA
jgi:hypothetical protein